MPVIKIRTITNREISCNCELDDTVLTLKEKIEHKEGLPVDNFRLIFFGQNLDDNKKLLDYKVEPGQILIMVPTERGN